MRSLFIFLTFVILSTNLSAASPEFKPGDWPRWRGPAGTGVAEAGQDPPLKWSRTENILWFAPVPGRGHGSPTIVGKKVFLATADEEKEVQSLLAFDRETGNQLWKTDCHKGGIVRKGNAKGSQASSSPACDGTHLYINFLNNNAIFTTCLDLEGKIIWQKKVSDFASHQGFGSSPALYENLVYVTTDSPGGGVVAALKRETGDIVWSESRPKKANYASPVIHKIHGKDQLLVSGCDLVTSLDPLKGTKLWECEGATTECVTTIVTDGSRVFVSGGYPRNHTQAIEADGSGKTAWENNSRVYVPSMIVDKGYLYAVLDGGQAACWKSDTGEEMWKSRLGGGFTSSLVQVNDRLYAVSESASCYVFRATPDKLDLLAENKLGEECFATPSICGSRIYLRVVDRVDGKRQEMLYCIGSK